MDEGRGQPQNRDGERAGLVGRARVSLPVPAPDPELIREMRTLLAKVQHLEQELLARRKEQERKGK